MILNFISPNLAKSFNMAFAEFQLILDAITTATFGAPHGICGRYDIELSPQQITSCAPSTGEYGCQGPGQGESHAIGNASRIVINYGPVR